MALIFINKRALLSAMTKRVGRASLKEL